MENIKKLLKNLQKSIKGQKDVETKKIVNTLEELLKDSDKKDKFKESFLSLSKEKELNNYEDIIKNNIVRENNVLSDEIYSLVGDIEKNTDYYDSNNDVIETPQTTYEYDVSDMSLAEKQFGESLQKRENKINEEIKKVRKEVEELKDTLNSSTKEYVALLSIMSGIILSLSGGFTLTSEAFERIGRDDFWIIISLTLLLGCILLLVLYVFCYFIYKIVNKKNEEDNRFKIFNTIFIVVITIFLFISMWIGCSATGIKM